MSGPYASGVPQPPDTLRRRRVADDLDDIIKQTSTLSLETPKNSQGPLSRAFDRLGPLVFTALSALVRLYRINASKKVIWDEAHFGKFGSHYLQHELYFDVHPPLGKLLVGLSGYLAGYAGKFSFESGEIFPEDCNFVLMRVFNCVFGILCTPLAYYTAKELNLSRWTICLITLLVVFEMISLTLAKFILLDSMLLFFTVVSFYCLVKVHRLRVQDKLLQPVGLLWLAATGISIGCVCSVKWVGCFVTALVGFYTVYDLTVKYFYTSSGKGLWGRYLGHWTARSFTLIVLPFLIYLAAFRVHFSLLTKSGTGDSSVSTLFQALLEDNQIKFGPRSVAFGSLVTLRSQGLSPNLLHSHGHLYPEGSMQQQVTTYGFRDENNDFLVEFDLETSRQGHYATLEEENGQGNQEDYTTLVKHGDTIRLVHKLTGSLLHSHPINAHISKGQYEVSCYANLDQSDVKDEWIVEIQGHEISPSEHFQNESQEELHPISTNFRLRHSVLGCYLATSGYLYPSWGFQQGEVVCKKSYLSKDKHTWWNIEDHVNDRLPTPEVQYVAPAPKFWKEFVLLNYGMMASNNALVPDPDKFDRLSSEWWEWPILNSGLRMCGWSALDIKFFLMGNPFVTWLSTASVGAAVVYLVVTLLLWRRQANNLSVFDPQWDFVLSAGVLPLMGWILHYWPFIVMGRVTYLHHYMPALYFAIFVTGFVMETAVARCAHRYVTAAVYGLAYMGVVGCFWHWRHLSFGMEGSSKEYAYLKLLDSWMI